MGGLAENKANSAQLELELGLSLAISLITAYYYQADQEATPDHSDSNKSSLLSTNGPQLDDSGFQDRNLPGRKNLQTKAWAVTMLLTIYSQRLNASSSKLALVKAISVVFVQMRFLLHHSTEVVVMKFLI